MERPGKTELGLLLKTLSLEVFPDESNDEGALLIAAPLAVAVKLIEGIIAHQHGDLRHEAHSTAKCAHVHSATHRCVVPR